MGFASRCVRCYKHDSYDKTVARFRGQVGQKQKRIHWQHSLFVQTLEAQDIDVGLDRNTYPDEHEKLLVQVVALFLSALTTNEQKSYGEAADNQKKWRKNITEKMQRNKPET